MDALSYKTLYASKATVDRKWFVVDATGQPVGRLASEIAKVVKGKHKPSYTPSTNCGDHVIVINAEKVKFTGSKWTGKEYISHSLYPGGQKSVIAKDMLAKHPIRIIEKAVKGMLPKTILGSQMYRNLHVVVGENHQYAAQQPTELKF
jgi:large subunit ribosomal protein L13